MAHPALPDASRTAPPLRLHVAIERFALAAPFAISRGAKTEAVVVVAEVDDAHHRGRGECVPYARYGEDSDTTVAALQSCRQRLAAGLDRAALQTLLPAGAARNAIDCALWDVEAKRTGTPVWQRAGLAPPGPLRTAYTISLDTPEAMARAARAAADRPLLKIKLGADAVADRLAAVRSGAPRAELIVDANEAWRLDVLPAHLDACAAAGVRLVEQPLPAGDDAGLAGISRAVALCADESVHDRASLGRLVGLYDAVNIKLDKTGGLTEALALRDEARRLGFDLMVGCMVATSLAMAPAMLVAQEARVVDLDGPLLLARDRDQGLVFADGLLHPPTPALWG